MILYDFFSDYLVLKEWSKIIPQLFVAVVSDKKTEYNWVITWHALLLLMKTRIAN